MDMPGLLNFTQLGRASEAATDAAFAAAADSSAATAAACAAAGYAGEACAAARASCGVANPVAG